MFQKYRVFIWFGPLSIVALAGALVSCARGEDSSAVQSGSLQISVEQQIIKFRVIGEGVDYARRTSDAGDPNYQMLPAQSQIWQCIEKKQKKQPSVKLPPPPSGTTSGYYQPLDVVGSDATSGCAVFQTLAECESETAEFVYSPASRPALVHHWRCGPRSLFKEAMREQISSDGL